MGGRRRRSRAEHTEEWEQIELLRAWPEQRDYELIRPLVLFGDPVAERAEETDTSERTLYRRASAFAAIRTPLNPYAPAHEDAEYPAAVP